MKTLILVTNNILLIVHEDVPIKVIEAHFVNVQLIVGQVRSNGVDATRGRIGSFVQEQITNRFHRKKTLKRTNIFFVIIIETDNILYLKFPSQTTAKQPRLLVATRKRFAVSFGEPCKIEQENTSFVLETEQEKRESNVRSKQKSKKIPL